MNADMPQRPTNLLEQIERYLLAIALVIAVLWAVWTGDLTPLSSGAI